MREPANLPIIDASPIDSDLELKKPLGSFLGKGFLRRHLVSELKTQYGSVLEECLHLHKKRLKRWSQETLPELCRAFEARAELLRLRINRFKPSGGADASDAKPEILQDLHELQAWSLASKPATSRVLDLRGALRMVKAPSGSELNETATPTHWFAQSTCYSSRPVH